MAKRMRSSKSSGNTNGALPGFDIAEALGDPNAGLPQVESTATSTTTTPEPSAASSVATPPAVAVSTRSRANNAVQAAATTAANTKGLRTRTRPLSATATGDSAAASTSNSSTPANGKHVMLPAFLSKTFEIFSMPEFSTICGWNAAGDTIIVSQLESFVSMVLPRFFKHRNFPSFVRQLNLYGFHKTVLDSKRLEFQHPFFKRDRPDLLHFIKRKVSSSSNNNTSNNHNGNGNVGNNPQSTALIHQNSRLDGHREVSDKLLREMKELRTRSENMEKRLRELEIDNAIVRSDNMKLWKHLEAAKDKQMIMQEKMKKIMWILFQIYRGKQGIPKISRQDPTALSEDYINSSILGPKEFRDLLRFLAMDEPPLLGDSTNKASALKNQNPRKRKFVEVPTVEEPGIDFPASEVANNGEPSVVEIGSPIHEVSSPVLSSIDPDPETVTASPAATTAPATSNVLSVFSPTLELARIGSASESPVPADIFEADPLEPLPSSPVVKLENPPTGQMTSAVSKETTSVPALSTSTVAATSSPLIASPSLSPLLSSPTLKMSMPTPPSVSHPTTSNGAKGVATPTPTLDFMDDLQMAGGYNFGEGEEVMKKLEDFETSLLDEYDVNCLDTLLQQLKNSNADALNSKTGPLIVDLDDDLVHEADGRTA